MDERIDADFLAMVRKVKMLMDALGPANDEFDRCQKSLEEARAHRDHYSNELDKAIWQRDNAGLSLNKLRAQIQETQMHMMNMWISMLESEPGERRLDG